MKVIIVDDEILVRAGMRTIIPWEKLNFEIAGEASNAAEAIELARTIKPDIMMVDIVMPGMNGLELIRTLKNELPLCKFVILSCRSELEYFKEAIKLGVKEYVLKDAISTDELQSLFKRISDEIRRERVIDDADDITNQYLNRDIVLREYLNQVIKGTITNAGAMSGKLSNYGVRLLGNSFVVVVFNCGNREDDYAVLNICQNAINDISVSYVFKDYNDYITAIISKPGEVDMDRFIKNLCYSCIETVRQCLDLSITAGVSDEIDTLSKVPAAYQQAVAALSQQYIGGPGGFYTYYSIDRQKHDNDKLFKLKSELMTITNILEIDRIREYVDNMAEIVMKNCCISQTRSKGLMLDLIYYLADLLRREGTSMNEVMGSDFNSIDYVEGAASFTELYEKVKLLMAKVGRSISLIAAEERGDVTIK